MSQEACIMIPRSRQHLSETAAESPCLHQAGTGQPQRVRQHGISLVFSLITLAALSLAAVALIRSVDTGSTILGNLSFKQDTALAADEATRQAIDFIFNRLSGTTLNGDIPASGYRASNVPLLDPVGTSANSARTVIDWAGANNCAVYPANSYNGGCLSSAAATAVANNVRARYLIVRLCSAPGDPNTVSCARPLKASQSLSTERDEIRSGGGGRLTIQTQSQYYRILVRAQGGRKTVTYTETLVHF
jgi:hypothetical protein